jgi:pyruvate dehydrogenase E2 component (dihydrolipoamide acetyltransferase)
MSVSVSMPQLGESVTEGTVSRWLKREGDRVEADEPLLEVSTDKVDTEIPSPVSGILRGITVAEDETVAVGAELATIDEDGAGHGSAGGAAGAPADQAGQPAAEPDTGANDMPEPARDPQAADSPADRDTAAYDSPGYQQQPAGGGQGFSAWQQPAQQSPPPQPPAASQPGSYPADPYQRPGSGPDAYQGYQQQPYQPAGYPPPPAAPDEAAPAYQPYQEESAAGPPDTQAAAYQQSVQAAPDSQPAAYQQQAPPGSEPQQAAYQQPAQQAPPGPQQAGYQQPGAQQGGYQQAGQPPQAGAADSAQGLGSQPGDGAQGPAAQQDYGTQQEQDYRTQQETVNGSPSDGDAGPGLADGLYVSPLVRRLAAEHGIDLTAVAGTGVGGRIRKQDVLDAANARRSQGPAQPGTAQPGAGQTPAPQQGAPRSAPAQPAPAQPAAGQPAPAQPAPAQPAAAQPAAPPAAAAPPEARPAQAAPAPQAATQETGGPSAPRSAIVPSSLRGRTEKLSRSRQVIAQRMVESLQTSAQLTTVVEADVTAIARLRDRARSAFEAREGVKLSFLPFFALAAVEALKVHPKLNAVVDTASAQVTYHDAEHMGIAVDTERGLMVPVIRKAGDLNIAGLARKIADLAERTRAGKVGPDELSGGTFTLTNTGSRGALFDTPIINQPQVAILGTGIVVKRPVVVEDAALGEVITVRSMVYLALTYDHRLVDGADAARFLTTVKARLEEGAFETELGL